MGSVILLFSRSYYRYLSKHLSWSPRPLEKDLLVYYQLLQTSLISVQLLRSQLHHEGLTVEEEDLVNVNRQQTHVFYVKGRFLEFRMCHNYSYLFS